MVSHLWRTYLSEIAQGQARMMRFLPRIQGHWYLYQHLRRGNLSVSEQPDVWTDRQGERVEYFYVVFPINSEATTTDKARVLKMIPYLYLRQEFTP